MTQDKANLIFKTDLGRQLDMIYVTSDDHAFVRHEEAVKHVNGEFGGNDPLEDKTITEWYPDDDIPEDDIPDELGTNNPSNEQCINSLDAAIFQLMKDHPEYGEEYSTGWDMINTLDFIKNNLKQ